MFAIFFLLIFGTKHKPKFLLFFAVFLLQILYVCIRKHLNL